MVKWTDDQELAIRERDKNLLVSAAAGSGKTTVLVERIIELLIQDREDIDSFLIVTFTNAAAGEMREKIGRALYQALEDGKGDQNHLRRQIQLLDRASISTIHSFCINILKKYFHLIDMDPVFRIGDSTETLLLKEEALEELFENQYEKANPIFLDLVEMYGGNRNDQGLQDIVLDLYNFIQSKPEAEEWIMEKAKDFALDIDGFRESPFIQSLSQDIRIELEGALNYFKEALKISLSPAGPASYEEAIELDIEKTKDLILALEEGFNEFYLGLKDFQHARLKGARDADKDLQEMAKNHRDKGKKILENMRKSLTVKSPEDLVKDLNAIHPHMEYLGQMTIKLSNIYAGKKKEKSLVDFNDLEHFALKILKNPQAVEEYREKFKYIFVDEYQDSNLIQETLINSIKREDNVFLVGDVKQSIYRFRLADPSLFIEKYEDYKNQDGVKNRRIDLSANFRSGENILQGVNFIFENLMSKELGEIDYDDRARLNFGPLEEESAELENSEIELNILDMKDASSDIMEEYENIELEAHFVANKIKDLLKDEIYDKKEEKYRKISYEDIVILLRTTKGWADSYSEVLSSHGIPVYADDDRGYFESIEIILLMNLLKIIDNKRQDIPLLSLLRSPIFNFSPEELIRIRKGSSKATFYQALEDYLENNEDSLEEKIQNFLNKIHSWRESSRFLSIDDFIWKILIESGFYYYLGAMPGGQQRQANTRLLLDKAGQFQKTSMKGLGHFIKFVDQLKSSSGDSATAKILGENQDLVRIMSIHKSKGLEFPLVILGGLGKQFNLQDSRKAILLHKDLGLGPNYVNLENRAYNESIAKLAMKNKIKMENLSEEMRILYVAMTRPMDRLIMVGWDRDLEKSIEKWSQTIDAYNLSIGKGFMDWLGPILLRHPQGQPLRERGQVNFPDNELLMDDSKWSIRIRRIEDIIRSEEEKKIKEDELRRKLLSYKHEEKVKDEKNIYDSLDFQYEHDLATRLPSKLTVTDIVGRREDKDENILINIPSMTSKPSFMTGEKTLTGQEKGTIIHFILQHIRLDRVGSLEEIKEQVSWMVEKELLREEELKGISLEAIYKFFKSAIGRRMLGADQVHRETPFNLVKKAKDVLPPSQDIKKCQEDILIQGVIDCYFQEGEDLVLLDYKSDYYYDEESRDRLVEGYRPQILLYKEALEKIKNRNVKELYLYLLYGNEEVKI